MLDLFSENQYLLNHERIKIVGQIAMLESEWATALACLPGAKATRASERMECPNGNLDPYVVDGLRVSSSWLPLEEAQRQSQYSHERLSWRCQETGMSELRKHVPSQGHRAMRRDGACGEDAAPPATFSAFPSYFIKG